MKLIRSMQAARLFIAGCATSGFDHFNKWIMQ
jgi:hypothetical protein